MRIKSHLRYELKYLIRRAQMQALLPELNAFMVQDPFANELGQYPITSVYYDTPDYKAYWDKLEGHRIRRKVRVRVYGDERVTPDTPAFVEIKERNNARISKRRAALSYGRAIAFDDFDTHHDGLQKRDISVMQEVYYLYRTLLLRPTCVVQYDRMALEGQDYYSDLRVTFDTNVRGRIHDLSLLSTGYAADNILLPVDYVILEVKANETVPLWMVRLLSRYQCTLHRISKYCTVLEHSNTITARQRVVLADSQRTQIHTA